jgi:hypothetical protein
MATAKTAYGSVTAITVTGTSLADMAARECTLVVNTSNLYLDAILSGFIYSGAAVPTGNCFILLGSSDATTPADPLTGSDAAITLPRIAWCSMESLQFGQPVPGTGLVFGYKIQTMGRAAATKVGFENLSVSQAFQMGGLALPPQWGVVLCNGQGQAFDATAGHTVINYNGITQTIA